MLLRFTEQSSPDSLAVSLLLGQTLELCTSLCYVDGLGNTCQNVTGRWLIRHVVLHVDEDNMIHNSKPVKELGVRTGGYFHQAKLFCIILLF